MNEKQPSKQALVDKSAGTLLLEGDLEPLPGQVLPQFIRCSKPACRCAQGFRHGPYFYRVWREGTHVRKAYVKQKDVARVREQTRLYRAWEEELRRLAGIRQEMSRSLAKHRAISRKMRERTKS